MMMQWTPAVQNRCPSAGLFYSAQLLLSFIITSSWIFLCFNITSSLQLPQGRSSIQAQ
jgi:hypothetical protein